MDSYSKNPMLNSSQESVKNPSLFENSSNSRDEIVSTEQVVMEDALFKNNELATTNSFDEVFESVVVQFNFHEVLKCFESSLLLLLMCCAVVVVRQVLLLPAYNLEVIPEVLPSWSQHKIGCS